jgi:hypothetical protein
MEITEGIVPYFSSNIAKRISVVFFPQLGYMVAVSLEEHDDLGMLVEDIKANDLEVQVRFMRLELQLNYPTFMRTVSKR